MRKRILALALMASMVLTSFAGCNSGGGDNAAATDSTAESNASAESAAESAGSTAEGEWEKFDDVTIEILNCWNGGFKNPSDLRNNEVATAIRDKIGVTVEIEGIMMSETEKLNMEFASGDMHEVINAPYWGGDGGETAVIKQAGSEGRLLALDDDINDFANIKDAWKVGVVSQAFLENDLEYEGFGGKHYILPMQTPGEEESIDYWAYGVFARGDVFDKVGIEADSVRTPDDLYNFFKALDAADIKDVNGNDTIIASTAGMGNSYTDYLLGFTLPGLTSYKQNEDKVWEYYPLTEDWVDAGLFMWKLVNEGLFDKECFKQTPTTANEKLGNGTALVYAAQYNDSIRATKATGLYIQNPEMRYMPVGPLEYKDGTTKVQVEANGRNGTPCAIFTTNCQNLRAALTYYDYVNSYEGLLLTKYGIEGEDYTMDEDGMPQLDQETLDRMIEGDDTVNDERRERGIGVYCQTLADRSVSLFGEKNPGDAAAGVQEIQDFKKVSPVKIIDGYAVDKVALDFEGYDRVSKIAFEGTKQEDERQKAYFAATEEEARAILEGYQEYVRTEDGGIFMEYMEYLNEKANERGDCVG
ncbi:MAG TPA: hypothetical protein IAA58_00215 [Candidatus Gallacutalibacter stercoravium]|nr:hypothetical protein [Candidatus Gallacutalibacter stercoravium]